MRNFLKIKFHNFTCENKLPYVSRALHNAVDAYEADAEIQPKFFKSPDPIKKKRARLPFIPNLFLGRFDREILTFPEVLSRERYDNLQYRIAEIKNLFYNEKEKAKIQNKNSLLKKTSFYLPAMLIPSEYDGENFTMTEFTQILEEVSIDSTLFNLITQNCVMGKIITDHGTEELKTKYLPKLTSGELRCTLCFNELHSSTDPLNSKTYALDRENEYLITGSKSQVEYFDESHILAVLGNVAYKNAPLELQSTQTRSILLLIDKLTKGVTYSKLDETSGHTNIVNFKECSTAKENAVGDIGSGFKILQTYHDLNSLCCAIKYLGFMKSISHLIVQHCIHSKAYGNLKTDMGVIHKRVADLANDIYVLESMVYLTSGLIDTYDKQELSVEIAICQIFGLEKVWKAIRSSHDIIENLKKQEKETLDRILKELSSESSRVARPSDVSRCFVALTGLKHAGLSLQAEVDKFRNPVMYPAFMFKVAADDLKKALFKTEIKLDLFLHEYLHPTLQLESDKLERCTKKFGEVSKMFLGREGQGVIDPTLQPNLIRLADIAVEMYGLVGILSRASRSYSIGVHNADHEIQMCYSYGYRFENRIDKKIHEVELPINSKDKVRGKLAQSIFEKKGRATHPPYQKTYW